jgi:altronate dehydratase small subunit
MTDPRLLLLDPSDNVYVAIQTLEAGEVLLVAGERITVPQRFTLGHKLAARSIRAGEKIIKYRAAIGSATRGIAPGEHVHLHNMKSDYLTTYTLESGRTFSNRHDSH